MKKVFIFICLLFCLSINANAEDIYTITDFKVSKYDKDATTARQKAMEESQRKAFNTVLQRMAIDPSNGILISDDEISQMLRSMQIKNERITNNSYSALLTMEFSPDYVKYILNKYRISKSSPRLNSYLIIPILNENGETYLWGNSNRWITPFQNLLKGNRGILLIENDYSSRNALDINNITQKPTFSKFKNLAELYNVNNVVLITSSYNKGGSIIRIKIRVMNEYTTKNAHMDYEIENLNNVKLDFTDAAKKIVEYIDSLSENEIQEQNNTNIQTSEGNIFIFVPISSITDFNIANNVLHSIRGLKELKLRTLTKNMATYSVKYNIDNLQTLINSLETHGFSVNEKRDGLYIFM